MKSLLIRSTILTGALTLALSPYAFAVSAANQTAVGNGAAYLQTKQVAGGQIGASASETGWSAVALAAAGKDLSTVQTAGGTSLRAYLGANPPGAAATSTDWERSIIAITADGQNPYDFNGTDYVAKLRTFVTGGQIGSATAVNDDIFGLIALEAANVDADDALVNAELAYILSQQRADGGFSYTTDTATISDTNDTAAAIMALAAASDAGLASSAVSDAIDDAKAFLLSTVKPDGGFPYDTSTTYGPSVSDVSSTAWVLMALTALDQDNSAAGLGAQKYIRDAQTADGSFPYQPGLTGDVFDTAPAVTALAGGLYPLNVYDGPLPESGEPGATAPRTSPTPTPSPSPAGQVLGAATTPTPTPTPPAAGRSAAAGGNGAVLGASTLPAVGEVSNLTLLLGALAIGAVAGLAVHFRQRQLRRRKLQL